MRAAIVLDDQVQIIPTRRDTTAIPSVALIEPNGKTTVGEPAVRRGVTQPGRAVAGMKALIGSWFYGRPVQARIGEYPFRVVSGEECEAAVQIGSCDISFEEVTALVLKEVRRGADLALRQKVNRAVITCPGWYSERQREAVRVAGELAGFHVERVLGEPAAAALGYAAKTKGPILIYDLGGTTFDVSLVEVSDGRVDVLAAPEIVSWAGDNLTWCWSIIS